MRWMIQWMKSRAARVVLILLIHLFVSSDLHAQKLPLYTIKNGQMYIELGKHLNEKVIDSFIRQYDLQGLALKDFILRGFDDSIEKKGWRLLHNSPVDFAICKPLGSVDNLTDPAIKILFAEKYPEFAGQFNPVGNNIVYGWNKFRNKTPFIIQSDSIVIFYLRGNTGAREVLLAGSFTNWQHAALRMIKTDSGWIARVPLKPGKYWYKFIIDGGWTTDRDNSIAENDGRGNDNSVFYKTNRVFRLKGFTNAKRVFISGSFNQWREKELLMTKTSEGWELAMYLGNGTHTYRFIVDGNWMTDPANPDKLPNEFNDYNSVIRMGTPYVFYLKGYTNARQVVLAGSFNRWRTDELFMTRTADGWTLPYTLGPGNYEYRFRADNNWASPEDAVKGSSGNSFFVIEPNYTFRLKGYDKAKTVYIAGDFNNWSPNTFAMKREGNEWILKVHLTPGKQRYKFVVDGEWILDPANKLWEQNEHSTGNSVLWIERPNF
jgi:hypothetical protein